MKKLIKSLVVALVIASVALQANAAFILSTNTTTNGIYQLLATGATVSKVIIINSTTNNVPPIVYFYDANWQGTNYSNSAYITITSYSTNLVSTNISLESGMTNFWTNVGPFTFTNTVAASTTNNLPAQIYVGGASGSMVTYNPNLRFERGITIQATTNATILVTYGSLTGN